MTSSEVRRVRLAFGMRVDEFACVLGVHGSTVYRWECSAEPLRVERAQLGLLTAMAHHTATATPDSLARLGRCSARGAAARGGLFGLYVLLGGLLPLARAERSVRRG